MGSLRELLRYLRRRGTAAVGLDVHFSNDIECSRLLLGNEGARWCIWPDMISADSVVYTFGVGEDVSAELQLIRRFGLHVYAFDPTPRSVTWVRGQSFPPQFGFYEYGLAAFDGVASFQPPANSLHVSHSMIMRHDHPAEVIHAPVRRLSALMAELGHRHIDVLKMDIEGAEYDVIDEVLKSGIVPGQWLIEFHHRWQEIGIEATRRAVASLRRNGYLLFYMSAVGQEFSFVNRIAFSETARHGAAQSQ
jgi:FkbM family methyltransferase